MPVYFELKSDNGRRFEAAGCEETRLNKTQARVESLARWAVSQLPAVQPTRILGRESKPRLSLDVLHICAYTTDSREPILGVTTHVDDLGHRRTGPHRHWRANELPNHIVDAVRSFDDLAWKSVIEHLGQVLELGAGEIKAIMPPLAFISYRREPLGADAAHRLVDFLRRNDVWVWWDADRIGWGDVLGWEETQGIQRADAAIIVFSPDYLNGPGAQREWAQIRERLEKDPRFKAGALRVATRREDLPTELHGRIDGGVDHAMDASFDAQATAILRGLFGLGPSR